MNTFDPKHRYSDAAKLARLKNKKLFLFDIDGPEDSYLIQSCSGVGFN